MKASPVLSRLVRLAFAVLFAVTSAAPPAAFASRPPARPGDPIISAARPAQALSRPATASSHAHGALPDIARLMLPPPQIVQITYGDSGLSSGSRLTARLPSHATYFADRTDATSNSIHTGQPPVRILQDPSITEVRICNVAGECPGLVTDTLATDTPLVLYAAGYDGGAFQGNIWPVTWTVSSGADVSPIEDVTTTLDGFTPGSIVVTATVITTPTIFTAATLTVTVGAPYTLTLSPATAAISAGVSITYTATATDVDGNSIGDVTASTVFDIAPASGGTFVGNAVTPTIAGGWTVTGTHTGAGVFDAAGLTVTPDVLAILTLFPATAAISAGVSITYTATATDTFGNAIGNVTASTAFDIAPASGGTFAGNAVTPTIAGDWPVTGTHTGAGVFDTAALTVTPGEPYTLTLSPATAVISAGVRITYTATATDTHGNAIGNVTASTAFDIAPASGGTFVGNAVTPTVAGDWTVTGTHAGVFDTAMLTVTPNVLAILTLSPATAVISAGVRITYTATATDVDGNSIGDVTASTVFDIAPASGGTFDGSAVTPTVAGGWTVTGTHTGTGVFDTAALMVTPNVLAILTLSPATAVISAGVRITYTATATDVDGNSIGDVTASTAFSIAPASGGTFAGSAVTPTVAGGWTVTGTHTGTGVFDTAALAVTPDAPAILTLSPATAVISAGVRITYTATATDTFGNAIGNVTASTAFDIAPASGGTFVGNAVTPTVAGGWPVTGTHTGTGVFDTAALTVTPNVPALLTLSPATAAISAGVRITYTATATDTFGNAIGNVTASTAFDIAPASGGTFAGNAVTPTVAGDWTVTGTHTGTGVFDAAGLTVTPDVLVLLTLSPATAVISAGVRITYTAIASDTYGNAVGDVTASTAFDITPASGGTFAGNAVTPTVRNTYTVTGTHTGTGIFDTAVLTVTPGVPALLTLSPATAAISAGVRITYTAMATDTFGNAIGNVTASTAFSLAPAWGGTFVGNAVTPTVAGGWTVPGTHAGAGVFDTAVLTVTPGEPYTLTLSPATAVISAGVRITYTATATDVDGNSIGDVTASTVFSIAPASGGTFAGNAVTPTVAGDWTVTGTHTGTGVFDTAALTVTPSVLALLTLSPATAAISAGVRITYTATATDTYGNAIGNVTASTAFSIAPASGGTFVGNAVTPTVRSTYTVTGTHTGTGVFDTAVLTVTPDAPALLTLSPATAVISAGVRITYTATATDTHGNAIGDVTASTAFSITPASGGTLVGNAVTPTVSGGWTVTGTHTGTGVFDTAALTVTPNVPVTLTLSPATAVISAGVRITYTATATDTHGNAIGNVTAATAFDIAPASGGTFVGNAVTPTVASRWTVTGTHTGTGVFDTAVLTVTPGAPYTLTLSPATAVISAGVRITYTAIASDTHGNAVGDVTAATVFSIAPASGGTFVGNAVTPTVRNTYTVTGTHTGTGIFDTAVLTVTPNVPVTLTLSPATAVISAGVRITYTATATDTFGNAIGNVTASTAFSITPASGGTFVGSAVTPTVASRWTVTGTHTGTGVFDTAVLTVTPNVPYTLTLSPATAVISAGVRITYTATATDTYGNAIGNVTSGTSFSIPVTSGGIFAANIVTPTIAGVWTVTGTYTRTGALDTAQLQVTPAAFYSLSVEYTPAGIIDPINAVTMTLNDTLTAYAVGYDRYNNLIGAQTATWVGSGVLSGTLSPTTGVSTTLTPRPILSGTGFITATSVISAAIRDRAGPITIQAPLLRISKSDSPDPVTPGELLTYAIVYTNAGEATARSVVITETYPPSVTYVVATLPPVTPGNYNVWLIGDVPPGVTGTFQVYVQVASQFPISSVLTNTIRMSGLKVDTAIFTATTQVSSAPTMTISKVDSVDPVHVGDPLIYIIEYRNDGNAPATGIRITETYPSQMTFDSATPAPNFPNNVWLTDSLNSEQSRFIFITMRVNSPIADGTILVNQVTIDTNETTPFTTTEVTLVQAPIITLTKSASASSPAASSALTYTLQYTNSGSTYASSVVVTDAVPLNTTYLACAPAPCSEFGRMVTWNLGQVPSQATGRLTLTVGVDNNLDNGTVLTNTARISTTENVSAFVRITNTVVSAPMLSLSKSDGVAAAAAGQVLTYSLAYANAGTAGAQNVVIADRIPSNVTFQSCTPACVAMPGRVYSFTLNTVSASIGSAVTLVVKVEPTLPAGLRAITNTAYIQTSTPGDDPFDNLAQDVDAISTIPTLALGVVFSNTTPYPTKVITYYVYYTNTSAMNTTGVAISVTQSPYVTYIPSGWTLAGSNVYTRSIGNLAAGVSGVVTYVVRLPLTYTAAMDAFVHTFLIHDDGPGGLAVATAVNTATLGVPDLVVESVTFSPSAVTFGTKFTATVVLRNEGAGLARNPKSTTGFFTLDAFIDPDTPPPSYPFLSYAKDFDYVSPLGPGMTTTVRFTNLSFLVTQTFTLYFKVDNWKCNDGSNPCIPATAQHGLVPESDEYNNVLGPVSPLVYQIYAPVLLKN